MYRQMFISFKRAKDSDDDSVSNFLAAVKANVLECNKKMGEKKKLGMSSLRCTRNLLTGCLLLKQKILIG